MSAILKIKQARNPEQIAAALEPLAESMATLADRAQTSIQNVEEASRRQGREWSENQRQAAGEVKQAAAHLSEQVRNLQQATAWLQAAARELEKAQRGQLWNWAALALLSAILAALLATASVLWLVPPPAQSVTLDPQAVAEHLKPALQDAPKPKTPPKSR